jgi:hypothetical protein
MTGVALQSMRCTKCFGYYRVISSTKAYTFDTAKNANIVVAKTRKRSANYVNQSWNANVNAVQGPLSQAGLNYQVEKMVLSHEAVRVSCTT